MLIGNSAQGSGLKPRENATMNSHNVWAVFLFVLALLIRLAFLTATYPGKDHVDYMEDVGIAINLLEGHGYVLNFSMIQRDVPIRPTAAKPPIYPLLVSLVFLAFGIKNFFALFAIHAFLAAFTCLLLFLCIAKFSHYRAIIAGLASAVYPPFVYHSVVIPESTTVTLFVIAFLCYGLMNLFERFSQKRCVLLSVIAGLLAMTEPVTVPFIIASVFYVAYFALDSWRKIFSAMGLGALVFTATIAPWTLRNYLVFDNVVFIKSNFGSTLKDSLYKSGIRLPQETYSSLRAQVRGKDELGEDKAITTALLSWIRANPNVYLQLLPKNFMNFWWEVDRYKNDRSTNYLLGRKVPYILLLVFSLPAVVAVLWRSIFGFANGEARSTRTIYHHIVLMMIFTYTAIYTAVGAMVLRYHFPVQLGLFLFCADTIFYISTRFNVYPLRFTLSGSRSLIAGGSDPAHS